MSLLALKPKSGSIIHLFDDEDPTNKEKYVKDSPNGSLCGRSPFPFGMYPHNLDEVTCWRCKRAYDMLSKYLVPMPALGSVPVQIKLPKKKSQAKNSTQKKASRTHQSKAGSSTGTKVKSSRNAHSTHGNRK